MRDFRYLRVTSPDGRSLYEIYENHEGNERENEIPKRKTTLLPVLLFFFQRIKTYCETLLRKSLSSSDYILHIVLTKAS